MKIIEEWVKEQENNPFCNACEEKDCVISLDGTCAMIRKYQSTVKKLK